MPKNFVFLLSEEKTRGNVFCFASLQALIKNNKTDHSCMYSPSKLFKYYFWLFALDFLFLFLFFFYFWEKYKVETCNFWIWGLNGFFFFRTFNFFSLIAWIFSDIWDFQILICVFQQTSTCLCRCVWWRKLLWLWISILTVTLMHSENIKIFRHTGKLQIKKCECGFLCTFICV